MEQEVPSLVPASTGYLHRQRVCEKEENVKSQDGGDKTLSISILKLNRLHVLLCSSS